MTLIGFTYAIPDKIRAVFTEDPSTKISIIFNTGNSANTSPKVYYSTNRTAVTNNTSSVAFRDNNLSNNAYGMYNNIVKLNNLTPGTKYYFKIKDSTGETEVYYFETIPDNPDQRLSFICGGDSRSVRSVRQTANIIVSRLKPHAVFFDGDFTDNSNSEQWQNWFDDWQSTISSDGHVVPIVPARGNHENNNQDLTDLFGTNTTTYYSMSFGGNLFRAYTLNSENTIMNYTSQTAWLQQDLMESQDHIYRFAQYHKPVRPHTGGKLDGASQYAFWSPLFYQYNVDLALEGDSHTACTSHPIIPCTGGYGCEDGFKIDAVNGTVYTGQGTWGAPIRPADDTRDWTFHSGAINQFKLIFVDKEKIELRTVTYENSLAVNEVSIANRFALPPGLSLESGANRLTGQPQDVLIIPNKKSLTYPKIEISFPEENATYYNQIDVEVAIRSLATSNEVNAVVFYLDGVNKGIDTSEPFSFQFNASEFSVAKTYEINAIAYDVNSVPSPIASKRIRFFNGNQYTVTSKLEDSFNDAEQLANNKVDVSNYDLDLGYNGTVCGIRFTNINIPQNANITNSTVRFTADERKLNPTALTIHAEDNSYSANFLPINYNISNRVKAPVSVNWTVSDWNVVGNSGAAETTPNIKTVIQHLVNKPDWSIKSPVTLIFEGSGYRVAETYDSDSLSTPVLTVDFTYTAHEFYLECLSHPGIDTIYTNPGDNVEIYAAAFSNLNNISKIDFIRKSNGSLISSSTTNPALLNYTAVDDEIIIIKGYDSANNVVEIEKTIKVTDCSNSAITVNISSINNNSAVIEWTDSPNIFYKVYHKADTDNAWKIHCTPHPIMFLFGLESCTEYDYKIQIVCGGYQSCESNIDLGYITPTLNFNTSCNGPKINNTETSLKN